LTLQILVPGAAA